MSVPQPPTKRSTWQVGLRTLFLLITAVAVWTVYFANRGAIRHYEERIAAMRPLVRELTVADVTKFAVIKQEPYWYDENRWELHVPPGNYRLCLATRDIDETGFPPVVQSTSLAPGRHVLALEQTKTEQGWRVAILDGDREILSHDEPQAWYPAVGSSGGGQFDSLAQQSASEPLVLFRRRFTQPQPGGRSTTPTGPADGVMLWIGPEGEDSP
jgi:hypothetical protein